MPRNESAGKMSSAAAPGGGGGGAGGVSADRVQPGRVMFFLKDALVDDELVYQIATQCGEVKNLHRPSNRQLVFVQYEDPSSAELAIATLKRLPIFKTVDPALKSERFTNDKSGGGNNNNNDDQQQRNMVPGEGFSFHHCQQSSRSSQQKACLQLGTSSGGAIQLQAVRQQTIQFSRNSPTPQINASVVSAMNFYQKPPPPLNPELIRLLGIIDPSQRLQFPPPFPQCPPMMKNQHNNNNNKGGGNQQQQRQQQRGNANYGNMNGHGGGGNDFRQGRNDEWNDVSYSSMESGSPQKPLMDHFQPKFSLGCWACTKLPSFECRCGAFYCDVDCQRKDWPIHKDMCMPRLVPISYSNKRILQEANASKQAFSSDLQSQQQQQQQQHQQNRRGQNNMDSPRMPQQQHQQQQRNQSKDSPRPQQQQQQQKPQPKTPKSSPVEASPATAAVDDKVSPASRVTNKLQRLKIAKSVVGSNAAAAAAPPVMKGVLMPGTFPREGSLVKITASLPAGVIYIYHNNGKEGGQHSDYYLLTNRMFKAATDAKPLTEIPSVDDVIFAPYCGGYYRAKVTAVDGDKLEVFFVDFGNSDTVQWKQSREMADGDLKWAKYLTFPVTLEGVDSFNKEMMKFLEVLEHIEEFELIKAEPSQGAISVVLKRPKQSLTLNMELIEVKEREFRQMKEREEQKEREKKQELEKLLLEREKKRVEQEVAKVKEKQVAKVEVKVADPSNYRPVLFDESMETKQLPMGGPKKLLIIDASEVLETRIISVVAFEEVEKYAAVLEQCNRAGAADSNVYKPTDEGEVCLVLHEDDWSRALYDISDGSFMLLDVGIIASVPAANVRRFPQGLSHVVYNNEVFVENLPKLKAKMQDGKPDSVHGLPIDAKIAASEDGVSITIVDSGES